MRGPGRWDAETGFDKSPPAHQDRQRDSRAPARGVVAELIRRDLSEGVDRSVQPAIITSVSAGKARKLNRSISKISSRFIFDRGPSNQVMTTSSNPSSGSGYRMFSPSRASINTVEMTRLRYHFLFAGTTYHGAESVLVSDIASV